MNTNKERQSAAAVKIRGENRLMRPRRGTGIIECLILIIVLGITMSAIFTTLSWSVRNYTFARQEMKGRELLFDWVQTFESLWPTTDASQPEEAFPKVADIMNGTWDKLNNLIRVDGFTIVPQAGRETAGRRVIDLKIYKGDNVRSKPIVNLGRSYNIFSNETVSDNSLL